MCYYPFFPGTDLPDDDYTTLVPQTKPVNAINRNLSQIPSILENKENNSATKKTQLISQKSIDPRITTITGVTRRCPTIETESPDHTRSAPPSPALSQLSQKSVRNQISMEPIENEMKSASSEYCSLSANGPGNILSSGTLEVRLKFDAKNSKMWVFVIKATLEITQNLFKPTLVQVHLTVLPNKRIRFRTRVKPIDNAMFAEEFFCKVSPETIQSEGIRFRLYTCERFKREKLLAEATVMFAMVNLDEDMCKIVPLERAPSLDSDIGGRSHSSNSNSRQNSVLRSGNGIGNSLLPELEIGLAYDKNQAMLILEIGKGINFGMTSQGRAPDTYVQIILRNAVGEEIVANRTVTRHAQHHPVFAERYPYNIQENFLEQITLVISIKTKKTLNKTDHDIGWVSFGRNASGSAQNAHWDSMLNAQGETITRWHALIDK